MTLACLAPVAYGFTPESPEVWAQVKKGLKYLDENTDTRLGGKCVIGLAYIKSKQPDHPRVAEAVAACAQGMRDGDQGNRRTIYSCGMAIIFLCEHNSRRHSELIRHYLGALANRQKKNGAWGYAEEPIGDTSQTQYGALALWEAHQHGFSLTAEDVRAMSHWLIRTQDPAGGWTYKGEEGTIAKRVTQHTAEMTLSIGAAAMGSVLIGGDLFGLLESGLQEEDHEPLPDAVRAVNKDKQGAPPLSPSGLEQAALFKSIKDGDAWMTKNYNVEINNFQLYYMYSLERYKSFAGKMHGDPPDEPEWYNKGVDWLAKNQEGDGSWLGGCGRPVDTAFAILFLRRSTLQSMKSTYGGTLVSGRGLPSNLQTIKLSRGQIVARKTQQDLDGLLGMLSDEEGAKLDALVDDATALVGEITEENGRRFEQIARGGAPAARVLAVRALGRSGNLDYVPTLIFALTDPDKRVVIEARNGLRFISRKFEGFGLPTEYKETQLADAIERWKDWYLSIRPNAGIRLN